MLDLNALRARSSSKIQKNDAMDGRIGVNGKTMRSPNPLQPLSRESAIVQVEEESGITILKISTRLITGCSTELHGSEPSRATDHDLTTRCVNKKQEATFSTPHRGVIIHGNRGRTTRLYSHISCISIGSRGRDSHHDLNTIRR
jgi:hypothetical protein